MTDPKMTSEAEEELAKELEAEATGGGMPRPLRWGFYLLALGLLGLSIYFAISEGRGEGGGPGGWQRLSEAEPIYVIGMFLLVAANIVINGVIFWALVKPFETARPVGVVDMTALISATCLLNFLPMRAGMVGRAAYLKNKHAILYRVSLVMLAIVGGGTALVFVLVVAATAWRQQLDALWWAGVIGGCVVGAAVAPTLIRWKLRWTPGLRAVPGQWFDRRPVVSRLGGLGLLLIRVVDVFAQAGRLWLAARIFGSPIAMPAALLLATGGMFITLATPLPNGLGLREMIYGAMTRTGIGGEAIAGGRLGFSIGLIDRAAEALVFIVLGLAAIAYLHHRRSIVPDMPLRSEAASSG